MGYYKKFNNHVSVNYVSIYHIFVMKIYMYIVVVHYFFKYALQTCERPFIEN